MSTRDDERAAWLAHILRGRPARVTTASADASFRRYFRVHLESDTRILMDAPPPREDCRPFVHVAGLLADAGVNVPAIFDADVERGFLLLSDLGDHAYLDVLDDDNADALYGAALDTLVRMQAGGDAAAVPAYDEALLRGEMALFTQWFLRRHLGLDVDAAAGRVISHAFDLLVRECLAQPATLVHRDYHSRNLMRVAGPDPGVLDFQDAVRGPLTYDLVSLLRDVYVRWPERRVEGWVRDWLRRARDARVVDAGTGPDQALRWFDLTGVQRHLKVAGIFARLWYRDGKARYLADIPLTLDYLLGVAARHRELAALAALLEDLDVAARSRAVVDTLAEDGGVP